MLLLYTIYFLIMKILNKIQEFGYDKNYIIQKLNENELCHVTAIYYLMMNYESI